MTEKYIFMCSNPWCQAENDFDGVVVLPEEMVDDHNIAEMFCPKCNNKLELKETASSINPIPI